VLARLTTPISGLGLNNKAVVCIRAARQLESLLPLWSVTPADELLSGRQDNQAYTTADISRSYIVYFLSSGVLD